MASAYSEVLAAGRRREARGPPSEGPEHGAQRGRAGKRTDGPMPRRKADRGPGRYAGKRTVEHGGRRSLPPGRLRGTGRRGRAVEPGKPYSVEPGRTRGIEPGRPRGRAGAVVSTRALYGAEQGATLDGQTLYGDTEARTLTDAGRRKPGAVLWRGAGSPGPLFPERSEARGRAGAEGRRCVSRSVQLGKRQTRSTSSLIIVREHQ